MLGRKQIKSRDLAGTLVGFQAHIEENSSFSSSPLLLLLLFLRLLLELHCAEKVEILFDLRADKSKYIRKLIERNSLLLRKMEILIQRRNQQNKWKAQTEKSPKCNVH